MMQNEVIFQQSDEKEKEIIYSFFEKYFGKASLKELEKWFLWIKKGKTKEVFVVDKKVNQILSVLSLKVFSAGIPLGSIWDNKFQLEVEGSSLMKDFTSKIVQIKTDQFLYGKPIFTSNVKKTFGEFKKNDIVIVIGKDGLHYGVGKAQISSRNLIEVESNTVFIKGYEQKPFDRGYYLRKAG